MKNIRIRYAEFDDWALLLDWRNDESSREFSKTTNVINEKNHKAWLSHVLESTDHVLFIAERGAKPEEHLGMVRFDRTLSCDSEYRASINLNPKMRGQGLGEQILRLAIRQFDEVSHGIDSITVEVSCHNSASSKIFKANGFEQVGSLSPEFNCYRYPMRLNLDGSLTLERVSGTRDQIQVLFELLADRDLFISHSSMPSMRAHTDFVLAHPYRHWFLVRDTNSYCGTIYLHGDNSVGVNAQGLGVTEFRQLLQFVTDNFAPLPAIQSVRSAHFHVNVPIGSETLERAVIEMKGEPVQKTYRLCTHPER